MHRQKLELVQRDRAVVAADGHVVRVRARHAAPYPVITLGDRRQTNTLFSPKGGLTVRAADAQVLAVGEVRDARRVVPERAVLAVLRARHVVKRERLVPASDREQVGAFVARRVPRERPDGRLALNGGFLLACLVADRYAAVEHAEREDRSVHGPAHAADARRHLMLRHRLLLGRPEPEVARGARGELLRDRVIREALDRVIVAVLEDTLRLVRPDDDCLVLATRREALAVFGVRDAVERLLVAFERVQQIAIDAIVHEHAAPTRGDELLAVWTEGDVIDARLDPIALRHLVRPGNESAHRGRGDDARGTRAGGAVAERTRRERGRWPDRTSGSGSKERCPLASNLTGK